jgi:hypothetical protein
VCDGEEGAGDEAERGEVTPRGEDALRYRGRCVLGAVEAKACVPCRTLNVER